MSPTNTKKHTTEFPRIPEIINSTAEQAPPQTPVGTPKDALDFVRGNKPSFFPELSVPDEA